MDADSKIYIAGHKGMVGSAIYRKLQAKGYHNLVVKTYQELDLIRQKDVELFIHDEEPEYVFMAAARVGGILANVTYPAEFIYHNLAIQNNIIEQSYRHGVKKLLFLGSSCIYPKDAPQPMKEEYLLTGILEPTNEAYAIAKIAGIKMCQAYNRQYGTNFISVMPTNIYGPGDNYDLYTSHVLPALIRKFHEAKVRNKPFVLVWGTGTPMREFLYVEDLAEACIFLMNEYDKSEIINIGTGDEISVIELAVIIQEIIGFQGVIKMDPTKPDGMLRKLLDVQLLHGLGWKHFFSLRKGIKLTYESFIQQAEL